MTDRSHDFLIEDRSGAELDDKCGRAYFLQRLFAGRGIVPETTPTALQVGIEVHEDFAMLAGLPAEELTVEALTTRVNVFLSKLTDADKLETRAMERLYRRIGWLVAWALYMEPTVREHWTNVAVEKDVILDRSPLWVPVTPDRVLRNKKEPKIIKYVELKSTISASQKWLSSWQYAIQLHLGIKAMSEELGEQVKFGQVIGLMKGNESQSDHRLMHPFVWAWYHRSSGAWSHEYKSGAEWSPRPLWEYPDGLVQWIVKLGSEYCRTQFPTTSPVMLNEMMLDDWIKRRTIRQKAIEHFRGLPAVAQSNMLPILFPKKQSFCRPAFGDACPYVPVCWNAALERNPCQHGEFIPREPHHELEVSGIV